MAFRMRFFLAVLCLFIVPLAARAENLVTVDLAEDRVNVTTAFNGAHLVLYGTRAGSGHIAVVIEGPARSMTVRRKKSILGAWVNGASVTFRDVPSYYDYALDDEDGRKNAAFASLDSIVLRQAGRGYKDSELKEFREALIRNKQEQGLYAKEPGKVTFLNDNFFKVEFTIPANVHVGDYEIRTYYYSGSKIRDTKSRTIRVARVGLSAEVNDFSLNHSFAYGLISVALAIFAGWFSNRVRRRA